MQLRGLGGVEQLLSARLRNIANTCLVHSLLEGGGGERESKCPLQTRKAIIPRTMEDVYGKAIAGCRGREQNCRAGLRQTIRRAAPAHTEGKQQKSQQPRGRPAREVGGHFVEAPVHCCE